MFRGCALCAHGDGHVTAANRLGCVCGRQRPPGRCGERRGEGTWAARTVQQLLIRAEPADRSSEHRASVESSPKGRQGCYPPAWWHRRVSTRDARPIRIELAGSHACRRLMR